MNLLSAESFQDTFGPKKIRKRPKLAAVDLESLLQKASDSSEKYVESKDSNIAVECDYRLEAIEKIFEKGQSKRIWNELHKVIDSSDVIVQVLDARDPLGTRSSYLEKFVRKHCPHKHIVLILNKCDLIPTWVTARWVKILSESYPTLAFHASITNPFGKGSLIHLLRQFARLHQDKKNISVGFVGYPNVGKSSIINTLRAKKVCKVAPIPGETKVWQYITLFRRVFLVDCPGVVYNTGDSPTHTVLKGVVRVENIKDAVEHIPEVLARVKPVYMVRTYGIERWTDHIDFLTQFADKSGRLLKKGEPDLNTCARMILNDWQRGKIAFFVPPPSLPDPPEGVVKAGDGEGSAGTHAAAAEKEEVPTVQQKLKNIRVANEFCPEDANPTTADNQEDDPDAVDWDAVFANVTAKQSAGGPNSATASVADGASDTVSLVDALPDKDSETAGDGDDEPPEAVEAPDKGSAQQDGPEHSASVTATKGTHTTAKRKRMSASAAASPDAKRKRAQDVPTSSTAAAASATQDDSADSAEDERSGSKRKRSKKQVLKPVKHAEDVEARDADEGEIDDSGSRHSRGRVHKEPRLTTNKTKIGQHFYSRVNVKNKNYNRQSKRPS